MDEVDDAIIMDDNGDDNNNHQASSSPSSTFFQQLVAQRQRTAFVQVKQEEQEQHTPAMESSLPTTTITIPTATSAWCSWTTTLNERRRVSGCGHHGGMSAVLDVQHGDRRSREGKRCGRGLVVFSFFFFFLSDF